MLASLAFRMEKLPQSVQNSSHFLDLEMVIGYLFESCSGDMCIIFKVTAFLLWQFLHLHFVLVWTF